MTPLLQHLQDLARLAVGSLGGLVRVGVPADIAALRLEPSELDLEPRLEVAVGEDLPGPIGLRPVEGVAVVAEMLATDVGVDLAGVSIQFARLDNPFTVTCLLPSLCRPGEGAAAPAPPSRVTEGSGPQPGRASCAGKPRVAKWNCDEALHRGGLGPGFRAPRGNAESRGPGAEPDRVPRHGRVSTTSGPGCELG